MFVKMMIRILWVLLFTHPVHFSPFLRPPPLDDAAFGVWRWAYVPLASGIWLYSRRSFNFSENIFGTGQRIIKTRNQKFISIFHLVFHTGTFRIR